jgi:hypothetical protein
VIYKNDPAFPKTGWRLVDFDDLGPGKTQACEYCGASTVRYVYRIEHPTGLKLAVGSDCADHLEGVKRTRNPSDPSGFSPNRVPVQTRVLRWLTGWRENWTTGNLFKKVGTKYATIFSVHDEDGETFKGVFDDSFTRKYATREEAMRALYKFTVLATPSPAEAKSAPRELPVKPADEIPF